MSRFDPASPVWPRPDTPASAVTPLQGGTAVDLAIVGGGILGLSTALHAARLGKRVQVIEARQLGRGASGLNGGQVIPGLKYDPEWLLEKFGPAKGGALVEFAAATADSVFDLIDGEQLAVPHLRQGWIQAAHTETALDAAHPRSRQWLARGADVALLNADEIARLTGARGYVGGWVDRRAGVIDPLAYTLELARVAAAAGARLAEQQPVVRLMREGSFWRLATSDGTEVNAQSVLLATNAYTDGLLPGLARTIVPLHSFQIATAPLPADLTRAILPEGQAVSDSRRILIYFRKSPDGRLMLGGRGRMSEPTHPADWAHLERAMLRLYPALAGVAIEKRWFGRVAVTPDHLPHVHEPEPQLLAAVGCQGRGVGLMTALGQRLAAYVSSGDRDVLPLPVTPIRPIPLHGLRRIGVAAAIAWYRTRDALER